jgi:ATP-binding cassette subfamily C protein
VFQQSLGGVKEVKVTGREAFFLTAFGRQCAALARVRRQEALLNETLRLGVETAFLLGLLLVGVHVTLLAGVGTASLPLLGLYAYAGFRVIPSANRMILHLNVMRFARAAVSDLHEDVTELARAAEPPPGPRVPLVFAEAIALEHVSYTYDDERGQVLADVDLQIRRGESIGIVGPSGAGKSTLVDVLLGLLEPTGGRVTIDGRDLRSAGRAWQDRVGYVPQTPFLLEGSLRDNIAFGVPEDGVDPTRLATAARAAGLDNLVAALPRGLDATVGERGARLSGGERQRVAIARALYRAPEVLVFDEATTALDAETAGEVERAIEALRGDRTLIVIAHRLATVRRCDRLVFLAEGRVTGVGTYEELAANHAGFRAMIAAGD